MEANHYSTLHGAPINVLTEDVLYYIFHGARTNGSPIFPSNCRWVPAFVCRRWRVVIESITHADVKAASGRLRDALWDAPATNMVHHHSIVRASGMALMVRHGLSTTDINAWTIRKPDEMDILAILMASTAPERVNEAMSVVDTVFESKKWSHYMVSIGLIGRRRHESDCIGSPQTHHMLVAAAAGSWTDIGALLALIRTHEFCCIRTAILHAARHERVDVVRALLHNNMSLIEDTFIVNASANCMWMLVGRHGLLSVAAFLADLEQDRDPLVHLTEYDRDALGETRRCSTGSATGWNWLAEAAERNDIGCLDFCDRRGLDYGGAEITIATAAFGARAEFYQRIKAHMRSFVKTLDCGIHWALPMGAGALVWIVEQPEFECFPDHPRYILDDLFGHARSQHVGLIEIIWAAAIVARRWPDVWEQSRALPQRHARCKAIDIWRETLCSCDMPRNLNHISAAARSNIEPFLGQFQRGWRGL
jgi:hypothetical protein